MPSGKRANANSELNMTNVTTIGTDNQTLLRSFSTNRTKCKGTSSVKITFMDLDIPVVVSAQLVLNEQSQDSKMRSITKRMRKNSKLRAAIEDAVTGYLLMQKEESYAFDSNEDTDEIFS